MRPALAPVIFSGQQFSPASIPDLGLWLDPSRNGSVLTDAAVQLTAASSQYLTYTLTGAEFNATAISWAGWVYFDSVLSDKVILSRGDNVGSDVFQYYLRFDVATAKFIWRVQRGGVIASVTQGLASGSIASGAWYFISVYSDAAGEEIGISVNKQGYVSTGLAAGGDVIVAPVFRFGSVPEGGNYMDGRLDEWGYWTRTLSAGELDTLYNGGIGLPFENFTAGLLTQLSSFYRLRENTGNRLDSVGSITLTAANTPTSNIGIPASMATDGDPVYQINDQSGNARHYVQATSAAKPAYRTAVTNGQPIIRFDGSDDILTGNAAALTILGALAPGATVFFVNKSAVPGSTARTYWISSGASTTTTRYSGYKDTSAITGSQTRIVDGAGSDTGGFGSSYVDSAFYVETHRVTLGTVDEIWMNGVSQGQNDISGLGAGPFRDAGNAASNSLAVSLGATVAGTLHHAMDLGELLIYRRTLTEAERRAVERYLGRKWGVTVA